MTPVLVAFALLLLTLLWLLVGGRGGSHEPTARRRATDDVDHAELEAAERDVQEAADEDSVRDWGPGAGRPRPPELL
jgi:hypothetical protein